jgi:hypothetical protein
VLGARFAARRESLDKRVDQRRLTNPRFARDKYDLPLAAHRLREERVQLREFGLSADEDGCWVLGAGY